MIPNNAQTKTKVDISPAANSVKDFPFDIYITPECHIKLNEYATHALPTEIGGLAKLEINREHKNIYVTDIVMFPQHATGGHFEFSGQAQTAWMRQMTKSGRGDEIPFFRSIVHSHPVGCQPNMSGLDIEHLMGYADDEDAFSLIISAARDAKSVNMKMHYCCNLYGEKHIVNGLPVKVCLSADRLAIAEEMYENLKKSFGDNAMGDKDAEDLWDLCQSFLTNDVPPMWDKERKKFSESIKEHTRAIVSAPPAAKTVTTTTSKNDSEEEFKSRLTRDEQDELGYVDDARWITEFGEPLGKEGWMEEEQFKIQNVFSIGFEERDPTDEAKVISKTQAKKARKIWEHRVRNFNKKVRAQYGIGLYDLVVVDYSKMITSQHNIIDELANTPHSVDFIVEGKAGIAVEVAGQTFWPFELDILCTFEDSQEGAIESFKRLEEIRKLNKASEELASIVNLPSDNNASKASASIEGAVI